MAKQCKCGSLDFFTKKSGNNTGLYCSMCGKWQKWLNKDEIRLFEHYSTPKKKKIKMTNADRIRNMDDEELADFLYRFNDIDEEVKFCTNKKVCNDWLEKEDTIPDGWCKECLVKWLKSEVGCE